MEAFEYIVKLSLEQAGYSVTSNVKFPVSRRTQGAGGKEKQTHGYEIHGCILDTTVKKVRLCLTTLCACGHFTLGRVPRMRHLRN